VDDIFVAAAAVSGMRLRQLHAVDGRGTDLCGGQSLGGRRRRRSVFVCSAALAPPSDEPTN